MQRVKFLKRDRGKLFYSLCKNNETSLKELSNELGIKYSTFKKYASGSLFVPLNFAKKICSINNVNINSLKIKIYSENWGASKGGRKGIKTLIKNYPEKLLEWRKKGGNKSYVLNFGKRSIAKKIKKPKLSKELAEFIGIFLGDGTLTKNFVRIYGDKRYDRHYFSYISYLVRHLFGLEPKLTERNNLLIMTISSRKLCSFLKEEFCLFYGDKKRNGTKIPTQILGDRELIKACIRGLIDTDGCIGKSGTSLKLAFTSHNEVLLKQLIRINSKLRLFNKRYGNNLETCSIKKINRYMNLIGSSNLRNIIRFNEKIKEGKLLYKKEILNYYSHYRDLKVPVYGPVV